MKSTTMLDALRFGGRVVAALAGVRDADLDHHVARRAEAADLPAVARHVVGQAVAAQRGAPERRRHDVRHEAAGDRRVALDPGRRRRLLDLALADARRVDVGLVRQVHQVVDHQAEVAVDVVEPAAVDPLGVLGPRQVVQPRGVGERLLARPDPDEAVAFDRRIAPDRRPHALPRHADALAVAAHHQAVVAADDAAVLAHRAERQRRAAVRAEVLQRRDRAALGAEQHHAVAADGAAERPVGDLVGRAGDVPGVLQIGGHAGFLEARAARRRADGRHSGACGRLAQGREALRGSPLDAADEDRIQVPQNVW